MVLLSKGIEGADLGEAHIFDQEVDTSMPIQHVFHQRLARHLVGDI